MRSPRRSRLVEQASQLPVDGIVLNPSDWLKFGLLKTTAGEHLHRVESVRGAVAPTLWGRLVALTPAMPQGTALVGAFRSGGGQLFQRGGLRVEASNSHSDFFCEKSGGYQGRGSRSDGNRSSSGLRPRDRPEPGGVGVKRRAAVRARSERRPFAGWHPTGGSSIRPGHVASQMEQTSTRDDQLRSESAS